MNRTRSIALAGAAALTLLLGPVPAANAEDAPPVSTVHDGRTHTLTLITGDGVRIAPDGTVMFLPGRGREDVGYVSHTVDGDTFVIPKDALAAYGDGRLDRRLFNVSALVRDGYADQGGLPLIVSGGAASFAKGERLNSINATASTMDAGQLSELWSGMSGRGLAASKVWLDGKSKPVLDRSVPQVGAPAAWSAGYDGTGTTIAIIDTGYDSTHPDLAGRVKAAKDFTGTSPEAADDIGHGTHVASIAAGSGAASNGKYKGVAPGADLLIARVCVDGVCEDSDLIAGMEWAATQGADVANISLAGPTGDDNPIVAALERLTADRGTLFAVAAGNSRDPRTIDAPGSAPSALTVSSVTKTDQRSDFSSQGPNYDWAMKPDITAPGSDITAARAAGTEGEGSYATYSGTSMATPHVAGAAALLKQQHPDWAATQLKRALMSSAKGLDGLSTFQEGAGRLDLGRAITQTVTADGGIGFGMFTYPQDQATVTKTVTYTNDGDTEVTLDVALTQAAPGFAVDRSQVTIPAHGKAGVTVSYDPDPANGYGDLSAELVASNTTTSVRTPLGASAEEELYELSMPMAVPDGTAISYAEMLYRNVETGEWGWFPTGSSTPMGRVAPGHYVLIALAMTGDGPDSTAYMGAMETEVRADTAVPVDLRGREPLTIGIDEAPGDWHLNTRVTTGPPERRLFMGIDGGEVRLIPGGPAGTSLKVIADQHDDVSAYNIHHVADGPLPDGLDLRYRLADLARVDHVIESQGVTGLEAVIMSRPEGADTATGRYWSAPGSHPFYYTPGTWHTDVEWGEDSSRDSESGTINATAGTRTTQRWNRAPLGVGFHEGSAPVSRQNGRMYIGVGMFTGPDPARFSTYGGEGCHVTVDVGGERVAESSQCLGPRRIPDGLSGDFTLRIDAERNVPWSTIGTRSTAEYHWKQGYTPDVEQVAPLNAARINATGVKDGVASAALPQLVTLSLEKAVPEQAAVKTVTFEVSYDGGKTWKTVPISRYGNTAMGALTHPAGATSVSTRVSMVDTDGNTSVQTTIGSYGLK